MTISNTSRTAGPFIGNGITKDFPFSYKVFAREDLLVAQTVTATGIETLKSLESDYTITLNANQDITPGGVISMIVAPPVGTTLAATSNISLVQSLDLTNQGGFHPKVINDALDRLVINMQQLAGRVGQGLGIGMAAITEQALASLALVSQIGSNSGSSLVGFIQSVAGAVKRTVQDKLRDHVSIKDFGAVGNGIADDTLAIRAAIAAVGYAYIPRGMKCKITETIVLSLGHAIFGDRSSLPGGAPQSQLVMAGDASAILCEVGSGYNRVHDLFIDGPGADKANSIGIQCIHNSFSQFERLFIRGFHYGVWDDAVQANVYRDIIINSVFYGVYWYSGYVQDYHQNCTYERIYVSGISDTGFMLNGGTSVDSLCKGNAFRECAADGAAQNGWSVIRVLDTGFYNCYTELFAVTGYYFQDCKNCHIHGFFAGAGSATATVGTRCLHVVNSSGMDFCNFTLRGDKYPNADGAYAQHIYFQGGPEYSNSLTNYMREDVASPTINLASTNTLTILKKVGGLAAIRAGRIEGDGLVLDDVTPDTAAGQVAFGRTLSFSALPGDYAVPPTAAAYLIVSVNGVRYGLALFKQ